LRREVMLKYSQQLMMRACVQHLGAAGVEGAAAV